MTTLVLFILFMYSALSSNCVFAMDDRYLTDPLNSTISSASSTKSLRDFIKLFHEASLGPRHPENMKKEAEILKNYLDRKLNSILDGIVESNEKENLIKHFYNIAEGYQKVLRLQDRNIESFIRGMNESSFAKDISEIKRMMTKESTIKLLNNTFQDERKRFSSTCRSKMSHMQLLDALLSHVQIAMAQYHTINYISLLKTSNKNPSGELIDELIGDIEDDYYEIATGIKKLMSTAFRDIRLCDSRIYKDDKLHSFVTDQDSPYAELQALTLTYYKTSNWVSDDPKCDTLEKEKPREATGSKFSICEHQRSCSNGFLSCKKLYPQEEYDRNEFYKTACVNPDLTAHNRYIKVLEAKLNMNYPPSCDSDGYFITVYASESVCECVCIEKNYYFVEELVTSDYENDKVVVGARLAVEGNGIYIQIQEAKILANGSVDKSSLTWKPIKKDHVLQDLVGYKKHSLESVDLTEIDAPTGQVVTGLRFALDPKTKRIKLLVYSNTYNSETGKLNATQHYEIIPDDATDEYKLEGQEASTKSSRKNTPVSKNNQYVSFTITDPKKDGGQTTIPFIDTQKVESVRPTPLAGAGLYLKGQPGYGGFLALKLYSYNTEPFVYIKSDD